MKAVGGRYSVDNVKKNVKLFSISYLLRSTVWVMPILPIWWVEKEGISIATYITLASIVPLVSMLFDLPFSIFADKIGLKKSYMIGLLVFALSFLFPIFFSGITAYVLYLVFCMAADGLLSGVDMGLLRDITGYEKYRTVFSDITKKFYIFTIPFFFGGVVIYNFSPELLFFIQFFCIVISVFVVSRIKISNIKQKNMDSTNYSSWKIKITPTFVTITTLVLLFATMFNGIVQFQNRTIQLLVNQVFDSSNSLMLIATLFGLGNILSSLGVSSKLTNFMKQLTSAQTSILLGAIFLIATLSLSSRNIFFIFIGYILISLGKGMYRPFVNALFAHLQPSGSWKAKWFSISTVTSGIIIVIINFVFSKITTDVSFIQLLWGCLLLLVTIPMIIILKKYPVLHAEMDANNSFSGKKSYRLVDLKFMNSIKFQQNYANDNVIVDTERVVTNMEKSSLPAPKVIEKTNSTITYEFLEGIPLEKIKSEYSDDFIESILQALYKRKNHSQWEDYPLWLNGTTNARAMEYCDCISMSHGDLHPGNIIIKPDGDYKVIDWDSSGLNTRLIDEFSIIWHPFINLSLEERISWMNRMFESHTNKCKCKNHSILTIIEDMINCKINDIESWGIKNQYIDELYEGYHKIWKDLKLRKDLTVYYD